MPIFGGLALLLLVLALWVFFRPQHTGPVVRPNPPRRVVAVNPDDHEEFLRRCRERVEQQRRAARERRTTGDES
ncbi:MAG TPA: hypothetical protein VGR06_40145 [Actinophytocola sp.]|jgi:hypothetical protein|uniref:hypothetical protein n=1 Tax=Actinophytocola sp. TaxID=1872138 RepID=UPI002E0668A1|nr:hypothetical protein [Actinophytocola sp.]